MLRRNRDAGAHQSSRSWVKPKAIPRYGLSRLRASWRSSSGILRSKGLVRDEDAIAAIGESLDDDLEVPQVHQIAENKTEALLTQSGRPWVTSRILGIAEPSN